MPFPTRFGTWEQHDGAQTGSSSRMRKGSNAPLVPPIWTRGPLHTSCVSGWSAQISSQFRDLSGLVLPRFVFLGDLNGFALCLRRLVVDRKQQSVQMASPACSGSMLWMERSEHEVFCWHRFIAYSGECLICHNHVEVTQQVQ